MIAAQVPIRSPRALAGLGAVFAALVVARGLNAPPLPADFALPDILCATANVEGRPTSQVAIIRSDALADQPGKRITTLLVRYAPRAATPRHKHGGPMTAYVIKGRVWSKLSSDAGALYAAGESFFEPLGGIHDFIENPSDSEAAELLAVMVHDEGVQLTTLLD